jgi:type I restriction enzyme R subunit
VLQNYDEFASLKELQSVDLADPAAVEAFKAKHYLSDEDLTALQAITLPPSGRFRTIARPTTMRDWLRRERRGREREVHHRLG